MKWIDEMFATVETDRAAASLKAAGTGSTNGQTVHLADQRPDASIVWGELVASITKDVNDFNQHHQRAGQTPVGISQRNFQCEVHVPGLRGNRLVLTLVNNDLHVSIHPDFPTQLLTITIELGQDGQHSFWVLGEAAKAGAQLSVQQLSEYLLKPIFSAAATARS
jgi:hypothetical protein